MKCPNCKSNLPDSANFCDRCGYEFSHASPSHTSSSPVSYGPYPGTQAGPMPVPRTLTGTVTRPSGILAGGDAASRHAKGDWMRRLMTKCIIVTVATLAVSVIILMFNVWPGCLVSASLLLYALAGTAGCIAVQLPGVCDDLERDMGSDRASLLLNQIVNLSVIWELFWLAAGLVCLSFSWWAVLLAEFVNLSVLMIGVMGALDEL